MSADANRAKRESLVLESLGLGPDLCLSGGADGADLLWGESCGAAGIPVVHFSFDGHRTRAPARQVVRLGPAELAEADPCCRRANRTLGRHYPPGSPFTRNLLRRSHYQVAWSQAVYAVGTLKAGLVQGGTAWAVQMFIDRQSGAARDGEACEAYVFCQDAEAWFAWRGAWQPVEPPRPSGVFAGIGTRRLNVAGRAAIPALLRPAV